MRAPEYNEIPLLDTITIHLAKGEFMEEKYTSTKGRIIEGECLVCFTKFPNGVQIEIIEMDEE